MEVHIDGSRILDEAAFHREIASALAFPAHYGANLNALWDTLTTDIARPIRLVWIDANISKLALGNRFDSIVELLQQVQKQDIDWGLDERFEFMMT
jgi:ribonuclease inhibitor